MAASPQRYGQGTSPRIIPRRKQPNATNIQWTAHQVKEWTEVRMAATIPENIRGYGKLGQLARTHLTAIIHDYQFLSYQMTFEDTSIEQKGDTIRLMAIFIEIIDIMTTMRLSKTYKHYSIKVESFRKWYAEPNNAYENYKKKYAMHHLPFQYLYDELPIPRLSRTINNIRKEKFREWLIIKNTYFVQFAELFNRIRHTFAAMIDGSFQYISLVHKNYNSMVRAMLPYLDMINTQLTMLLEFSPKEKTNLYEFESYMSEMVIGTARQQIRTFFYQAGVSMNTPEDLKKTLKQWEDEIISITEQSKTIKIGDVITDKYPSFESVRDSYLVKVKSIRETVVNTMNEMDQNYSKSMNPFYNKTIFITMFTELTGYYYILDAYSPKRSTIDEYTSLAEKLSDRLPVIEQQIHNVTAHEVMIGELISTIHESIQITQESPEKIDLSFLDAVEKSPSPPLTTLSSPKIIEPHEIRIGEEPYPTYGSEFFFDEFLN